jgi:argininosuccinate lyase
VGKAVRHAIGLGMPLERLPLADLQKFEPRIGADVFGCLELEASVGRRNVSGGTGARAVSAALAAARTRLDAAAGA